MWQMVTDVGVLSDPEEAPKCHFSVELSQDKLFDLVTNFLFDIFQLFCTMLHNWVWFVKVSLN